MTTNSLRRRIERIESEVARKSAANKATEVARKPEGSPMIVATIPGKPMGEMRAGRVRCRGFTRTYVPKKSSDYRALVQHYVAEAMRRGRLSPATGPVRVTIEAFRACPKSDARKRNPRPRRRDTSRPDGDNIAKIVFDSLNGVAWVDDAQVSDHRVLKWIAAQGEAPRVVVTIEEVDHESS